MQILIAQVVKIIVDFFKELLAKAKLKQLDTDYKEKRDEARKQIEEAAQATDDFLFGYELYVDRNGAAEVKPTSAGPDVRPTTEAVRGSSEEAEGGSRSRRQGTPSQRINNRRAEEAARRRKGRGKKG